jgi:hypothetical protein
LTFVKELGEFFGSNRPEIFGFIDSIEAVDIKSPGLEFLEGTYFWEGNPRHAQANNSSLTRTSVALLVLMIVVRPLPIAKMCRLMHTCLAAGKR